MAIVTLKDAGLLTGKGSATIYRHIKSGKLSKSGGGVDTSELIRVYGALKEIISNDKGNNSQNEKKDSVIENDKLSSLEREIELLKKFNEELIKDKERLYEQIQDYRRLLTGPVQVTPEHTQTTIKPEPDTVIVTTKKSFSQRVKNFLNEAW
jgi:hypothetical protein